MRVWILILILPVLLIVCALALRSHPRQITPQQIEGTQFQQCFDDLLALAEAVEKSAPRYD